VNRFFI